MTESEEVALITEAFPKFRGKLFKRYEGDQTKHFPKIYTTHKLDYTRFYGKNGAVWRFNPLDKSGNFIYVLFVFEKDSQVLYEEIIVHVVGSSPATGS